MTVCVICGEPVRELLFCICERHRSAPLFSLHRQYNLLFLIVKSMQRSGTEAIKTQTQPSKPKREITKNTNSQNTKGTYGQPGEQLFSKRWSLSNPNRTKNNMKTRSTKLKRHRNSDTKYRQQGTTSKLPPWNGQ